ncbi:hypothetical protein PIB30_088986 [Stylosanthes scabra]|uniref:Uncharacterized protein n=1 Tax=Stylosanthes scabra TaxID=79078 RepID=A0ABU6WS99_9FABA|nr:hypothetical protein [Stylosanthes scabra]
MSSSKDQVKLRRSSRGKGVRLSRELYMKMNIFEKGHLAPLLFVIACDMRSGVFYYEYEVHKEYDDADAEQIVELGTLKIRRYHFKDEKFTRSVHSGRFDLDRPYEFPIAMLGGDCLFGTPRSTPSSNVMPSRAPRTGPSR